MRVRGLLVLVGAFAPLPAQAEVTAASDSGFVPHHEAEVAVAPDKAWAAMLRPAGWWSPAHSYSGDAVNFSIEAAAGGCFCEAIPDGGGSVEHMRVVYVDPRVRTLRLSGALGPLQAEALGGALTMTVEPAGTGARIVWDYVIGGYARGSIAALAAPVDTVVGEQLARLAASLGGPRSSGGERGF